MIIDMVISSDDLDPHVLQSLMAGLNASFGKSNPTSAERLIHAAERNRMKADFDPLKKWLLGGMIAASAASASVFAFGLETGAAIGTAIGLWNGIFWGSFIGGMIQAVKVSNKRLNTIHPDLLSKWIPLLDLTRQERAYAETVALLARPETQVDESTARHILNDLNSLMEQCRHLDHQREDLLRVAGAESIENLTAERERIAARLGQTQDSMARADLEESLHLVESRLRNASQMAPSLERLDAQQEKIIQTLASVQSSLARIESAPSALDTSGVELVKESLTVLTRQTKAVEDAVQEVMTVTAGQ